LLCTLDPGSMPEGMRAGEKGVLVHALPPHWGLYIWQAIAWQALLIWERLTLHPEALPLIPVPEFGPDPQGMSLRVLLCHLYRSLS
jgi:hypothetical protein